MSLLPIEQEQALETLTILVDTREHETAEAVRRWSAFGKPWRKEKLDSGDYSAEIILPSGKTWRVPCVIERKMNLSEICGNFGTNRGRFIREFERIKESGLKCYLLIENDSWENAYAGRYNSLMKPQALISSLTAWSARYNAHIVFCKDRTTPKLIAEILYREAKEILKNGDW